MPNATSTLRSIFAKQMPLTMPEILELAPDLKKNEVSMALCYLMKQGYLSREKVDRKSTKGRKEIWQYTFLENRVMPSKEPVEAN